MFRPRYCSCQPMLITEDTENTTVFHYSNVNVLRAKCYNITPHSGGSGDDRERGTGKYGNEMRIRDRNEMTNTCRTLRPSVLLVLALLSLAIAAQWATPTRAQGTPPGATPPVATPALSAAQPSAAAPSAAPTAPAPSVPASAPAAPQPGEPAIGRALLPQDLSPWGMFLNADVVVKLVIIGLAFASLVTWTVCVAKMFELRVARRDVRDGVRILANSATLAQAHDQLRNSTTAPGRLMQAAAQEIRASANLRSDGLKERIAWQLERLEAAISRKISRGTGVLATIGSTAPFVGLFGTVWGIMNSFIGISNAHTTNLAVVAPGIAQALLATALGLVAAIPAVMIYNVLARSTAHYRALLGDASALVMRLVSRDLDRAKLPLAQAAE
jgi:biopolymer transport protein ExbB